MEAKIYLLNNQLVAGLDDGHSLEQVDAIKVAEMLWTHDVTSGKITVVDWHTDHIRAPLSGIPYFKAGKNPQIYVCRLAVI